MYLSMGTSPKFFLNFNKLCLETIRKSDTVPLPLLPGNIQEVRNHSPPFNKGRGRISDFLYISRYVTAFPKWIYSEREEFVRLTSTEKSLVLLCIIWCQYGYHKYFRQVMGKNLYRVST